MISLLRITGVVSLILFFQEVNVNYLCAHEDEENLEKKAKLNNGKLSRVLVFSKTAWS